jgi:hypothetical protein
MHIISTLGLEDSLYALINLIVNLWVIEPYIDVKNNKTCFLPTKHYETFLI